MSLGARASGDQLGTLQGWTENPAWYASMAVVRTVALCDDDTGSLCVTENSKRPDSERHCLAHSWCLIVLLAGCGHPVLRARIIKVSFT